MVIADWLRSNSSNLARLPISCGKFDRFSVQLRSRISRLFKYPMEGGSDAILEPETFISFKLDRLPSEDGSEVIVEEILQ